MNLNTRRRLVRRLDIAILLGLLLTSGLAALLFSTQFYADEEKTTAQAKAATRTATTSSTSPPTLTHTATRAPTPSTTPGHTASPPPTMTASHTSASSGAPHIDEPASDAVYSPGALTVRGHAATGGVLTSANPETTGRAIMALLALLLVAGGFSMFFAGRLVYMVAYRHKRPS